ncbi:MAG: YiiX/YebB-like N1pC/P60 family cysteine hydrolase [Patescibacteria group bacterium]|nr:YiiX/YebB-like N1pC/P60 family cysteine hydrolase [Patescibacteria group bacterium]
MQKARFKTMQAALPQLKIGDVILVHTKGYWLSKLIRRATSSYWSHVALVFDVIPNSTNHPDVLIIEALDRGIEIHRIEHYLRNPKKYDIGIKRIPILNDQERERFRGFFLDAVDTPYDFSRLFSYFTKKFVNKIFGTEIVNWITKHVIDIDQYVCTTFAQRAFYLAVSKEKRDLVLMRKKNKQLNFLLQMEEISPKDYAESENAIWLFNPHH